MDMAVDASGGNDHVFARDDFGGCANDQVRIDAVHRVGIARLPHLDDAAIANADVAFHDAPVIDDHRVGNDQIENAAALSRRAMVLFCPMPSRITLPPPKRDLVAVYSEVLFDFDYEGGISQADTIARR